MVNGKLVVLENTFTSEKFSAVMVNGSLPTFVTDTVCV